MPCTGSAEWHAADCRTKTAAPKRRRSRPAASNHPIALVQALSSAIVVAAVDQSATTDACTAAANRMLCTAAVVDLSTACVVAVDDFVD